MAQNLYMVVRGLGTAALFVIQTRIRLATTMLRISKFMKGQQRTYPAAVDAE